MRAQSRGERSCEEDRHRGLSLRGMVAGCAKDITDGNDEAEVGRLGTHGWRGGKVRHAHGATKARGRNDSGLFCKSCELSVKPIAHLYCCQSAHRHSDESQHAQAQRK